jgi:hypothetical protein
MWRTIVNKDKSMDVGMDGMELSRPLFGPDTVIVGVLSILVCGFGMETQTELRSIMILAVIWPIFLSVKLDRIRYLIKTPQQDRGPE